MSGRQSWEDGSGVCLTAAGGVKCQAQGEDETGGGCSGVSYTGIATCAAGAAAMRGSAGSLSRHTTGWATVGGACVRLDSGRWLAEGARCWGNSASPCFTGRLTPSSPRPRESVCKRPSIELRFDRRAISRLCFPARHSKPIAYHLQLRPASCSSSRSFTSPLASISRARQSCQHTRASRSHPMPPSTT